MLPLNGQEWQIMAKNLRSYKRDEWKNKRKNIALPNQQQKSFVSGISSSASTLPCRHSIYYFSVFFIYTVYTYDRRLIISHFLAYDTIARRHTQASLPYALQYSAALSLFHWHAMANNLLLYKRRFFSWYIGACLWWHYIRFIHIQNTLAHQIAFHSFEIKRFVSINVQVEIPEKQIYCLLLLLSSSSSPAPVAFVSLFFSYTRCSFSWWLFTRHFMLLCFLPCSCSLNAFSQLNCYLIDSNSQFI